jgi:hypothetical protein
MRLSNVVIAMGLLIVLSVAGHVAVREWYKPTVRSEQGRQAPVRETALRERRDTGVSVHRANAGMSIDFGTQRRQPLSSPEPLLGQVATPTVAEHQTRTLAHGALLPALIGAGAGALLMALLFGWRRGRKSKPQPAVASASSRGQLPPASAADLEKAELFRGRNELR